MMEKDNSNMPKKDEEQLNEHDEQISIHVDPDISQDALINDGSNGKEHQSPYHDLHNKGHSSSVSRRSVREQEELIASLCKENFDLKLKLHDFEENVPALISSKDDDESLVGKILDVMLNIDILKNEIEEKKELLREAVEAMKKIEDCQKLAEENHLEKSTSIQEEIKCDSMIKDDYPKREEMCLTINNSQMKIKELTNQIQLQKAFITNKDIIIKDLEEELKKMKHQITNQEELLNTQNSNLDSFKTAVDVLKSEKSELQHMITSQKQNSITCETEKMRKDFNKWRSIMADKLSELNEMKEKYKSQKPEVDSAIKSILTLNEMTKSMRNKLEKAKEELDTNKLLNISKENTKLIGKIGLLKNQLEEKISMMQSYRIEAMEARANASMMRKTYSYYQNLSNVLTNRLKEVAEFLNALLNNKNMIVTPDLEREIQSVVNKTLNIIRDLIAKSHSRSHLTFDATNLSQGSDTSEQSLCHQERCKEVDENFNKISIMNSELNKTLTNITMNYNKLKREFQQKNNKNKQLEKERNELKILIGIYKEKIQAMKDEANTLRNKHEETTKKFQMQFRKCIAFYKGKEKEFLEKHVEKEEFIKLFEQKKRMESQIEEMKSKNLISLQLEQDLKHEIYQNQELIDKMKKNAEEKFNLEEYIGELSFNCESLRKEKIFLIEQIKNYLDKDESEENEQNSAELNAPGLGFEGDERERNRRYGQPNDEISCTDQTEGQMKAEEDQACGIDHDAIKIQELNLKLHAKNKRRFQLLMDGFKSI